MTRIPMLSAMAFAGLFAGCTGVIFLIITAICSFQEHRLLIYPAFLFLASVVAIGGFSVLEKALVKVESIRRDVVRGMAGADI